MTTYQTKNINKEKIMTRPIDFEKALNSVQREDIWKHWSEEEQVQIETIQRMSETTNNIVRIGNEKSERF